MSGFAIDIIHSEWMDVARNRPIPFKIYYPVNCDAPSPVVVFSPGLGGTRQSYEYLGRHWAGSGYVVVHLQHKGTDNAIFLGKPDPVIAAKESLKKETNFLERPKDVSFAIDRIERLNEDESSPLKGRLRLEKIAVAGHSMGAHTSLASCGRILTAAGVGELDLSDRRPSACIAISGPAGDLAKVSQSYRNFRVPCLHITGAHDDSPVSDAKAKDRRVAFDAIKKGDQYLAIFGAADHMVFTGQFRESRDGKQDAFVHEMVKLSSTAFLDAYLKGSAAAKRWLAEGGFDAALGANGTFERKATYPS